jgi:hypothetical protein
MEKEGRLPSQLWEEGTEVDLYYDELLLFSIIGVWRAFYQNAFHYCKSSLSFGYAYRLENPAMERDPSCPLAVDRKDIVYSRKASKYNYC